jgi:hypothetical protein
MRGNTQTAEPHAETLAYLLGLALLHVLHQLAGRDEALVVLGEVEGPVVQRLVVVPLQHLLPPLIQVLRVWLRGGGVSTQACTSVRTCVRTCVCTCTCRHACVDAHVRACRALRHSRSFCLSRRSTTAMAPACMYVRARVYVCVYVYVSSCMCGCVYAPVGPCATRGPSA